MLLNLNDQSVMISCRKNDAVDGAMRGLKAVYDLNGFQKRIRYHIMRSNVCTLETLPAYLQN